MVSRLGSIVIRILGRIFRDVFFVEQKCFITYLNNFMKIVLRQKTKRLREFRRNIVKGSVLFIVLRNN